MEKINCQSGYNLLEDNTSVQICAWSPDKEQLEEAAEIIAQTKGKICSHGICHLHKAAWLRDSDEQMRKWDEAKERVDEVNKNKIIEFPSPTHSSCDKI